MIKRRAIILIALILVVAVVLLLVTRPPGSKRKLEAYKQQLLAQGEKLTIAELTPTPLPDSIEASRAFLSAMITARQPSDTPPAMKLIAPGHAIVAWRQEIVPSTGVSNIWPSLRTALQANRNTLSNLQSALNVPALHFNLDLSQGFSTPLPHVSKLKQAEMLASASAEVALHDGNFSEAWTNLHMAVSVIRIYHAEPLIVSHLVQVAMVHIAVGATWELLQSDHWTDAQLATLQSDWEAIECFSSAQACFPLERAMNIDFFQHARKSYAEWKGISSAISFGSSAVSPTIILNNPTKTLDNLYDRYRYWGWKSSWSYDEELDLLQCADATLKSIRRAELDGAFAPALKELDANLTKIENLNSNAASHFVSHTFGLGKVEEIYRSSLLKYANAEVSRRLVITAIALKRYQLRHGKYPEDLNALVPEFLPKVPVDFMDGRPLRYHPNPDSTFLLYSVGEDGEDNGGDPTPTEPPTQKTKNWLKARDIVWPLPAAAAEVAEYLKQQFKPPAAPPPQPRSHGPSSTNDPPNTQ